MYCAYVTELKNLRKHNNADRLLLTEVFGNTVIVDNTYHKGQKVVFFPIDGQLNEEYAKDNNLLRITGPDGTNIGGYLDSKKRNIKATKLRGEKSEGLVLPIETLSKYADVNTLKVGDQITVLNGVEICKKYIPYQPAGRRVIGQKGPSKNQLLKQKYPTFHEHVDTEQLAYNLGRFKPGDTCYITLKMHGTSARTSYSIKEEYEEQSFFQKLFRRPKKLRKNWENVSGTRRTILENYEGGYYGNDEFRKIYHNLLKDKLPKGMTVYYEIVGWIDGTDTTIMPKCANSKLRDKDFQKKYGKETVFSYGCEPGTSDMYVYRITFTNEDDYTVEVPWEQVKLICDQWGVKHVPEFDKFLYTTEEDLLERVHKYNDGPDPIGKTHVREGVVVRIDNREKFTAFKDKNFSFKVLEGIVKDLATEPDMEEAQEFLKEEAPPGNQEVCECQS